MVDDEILILSLKEINRSYCISRFSVCLYIAHFVHVDNLCVGVYTLALGGLRTEQAMIVVTLSYSKASLDIQRNFPIA